MIAVGSEIVHPGLERSLSDDFVVFTPGLVALIALMLAVYARQTLSV